jgi:hypothetical protein
VLLTVLVLALTMAALPVSADQPPRPFKGAVEGGAEFLPGTDPFTGEQCPNYGVGIATLGFGTGTVTHLGRVDMASKHCSPAGDEMITGKATLEAANGDILAVKYYGPIEVEPVANGFRGTYTWTVIGPESTGRFHDADGGGLWNVDLTFEDFFDPMWPGSFSFTGSIDY